MAEKFYAVCKGRKTGIFKKWEDCEKQVKGVVSNKFESWFTMEEAVNYMKAENLVYLGKSEDYLHEKSWVEDGFLPFEPASEKEGSKKTTPASEKEGSKKTTPASEKENSKKTIPASKDKDEKYCIMIEDKQEDAKEVTEAIEAIKDKLNILAKCSPENIKAIKEAIEKAKKPMEKDITIENMAIEDIKDIKDITGSIKTKKDKASIIKAIEIIKKAMETKKDETSILETMEIIEGELNSLYNSTQVKEIKNTIKNTNKKPKKSKKRLIAKYLMKISAEDLKGIVKASETTEQPTGSVSPDYGKKYGREIGYRKYCRYQESCMDMAIPLIQEVIRENVAETLSEKIIEEGLYPGEEKEKVKKEMKKRLEVNNLPAEKYIVVSGPINESTSFIGNVKDSMNNVDKKKMLEMLEKYKEQKAKLPENKITESDVESWHNVTLLISKIREQYKDLNEGEGVAYVDGTYDHISYGEGYKIPEGSEISSNPEDIHGLGVVFIYKKPKDTDINIEMLYGGAMDEDIDWDYKSWSQVGELGACLEAIKYADQLGLSDLKMVCDCKNIKYASYGMGDSLITKLASQYIYDKRMEKKMKIQFQSMLMKTHAGTQDGQEEIDKIFADIWGEPGNVLADGLAELGANKVAAEKRKDENGNNIKRKTLEECMKSDDVKPFLE